MSNKLVTLDWIKGFLSKNKNHLRRLPSDSQMKQILTELRIPEHGNSHAIKLIVKFAMIHVDKRREDEQIRNPKPFKMVKPEWQAEVTYFNGTVDNEVTFAEFLKEMITKLGDDAPEYIEYLIHAIIITRMNKSAAKLWEGKK